MTPYSVMWIRIRVEDANPDPSGKNRNENFTVKCLKLLGGFTWKMKSAEPTCNFKVYRNRDHIYTIKHEIQLIILYDPIFSYVDPDPRKGCGSTSIWQKSKRKFYSKVFNIVRGFHMKNEVRLSLHIISRHKETGTIFIK